MSDVFFIYEEFQKMKYSTTSTTSLVNTNCKKQIHDYNNNNILDRKHIVIINIPVFVVFFALVSRVS